MRSRSAAGMVAAAQHRFRKAGRKCRMERARSPHRRLAGLIALATLWACGCQTVRTPEEKIAASNLPREFNKSSMPTYAVEPPDLLLVEVLDALPARPITGEHLVRPDGTITLGFYGDIYV